MDASTHTEDLNHHDCSRRSSVSSGLQEHCMRTDTQQANTHAHKTSDNEGGGQGSGKGEEEGEAAPGAGYSICLVCRDPWVWSSALYKLSVAK